MVYSYKGSFPQGESVVGKLNASVITTRRGGGMSLVFSGTLRASYIGRIMENAGAGRQSKVATVMARPLQAPCEV